MQIPEPAAVFVSVLTIVTFLFLFRLTRGPVSERQQTAGWVVFGVVFFSLCGLLFRNQSFAANHPQPPSAVLVDRGGAASHR